MAKQTQKQTEELIKEEEYINRNEDGLRFSVLYYNLCADKITDEIAEKMLVYLEEGVSEGSEEASLVLGHMYMEGEFVELDEEKADFYLTNASLSEDQDIAQTALTLLACLYKDKDKEKAIHYMVRNILENQNPISAYLLGNCYLEGEGVPMDEKIAFDYYMMANNILVGKEYVSSIHGKVYFQLGDCYLYGIGIEKDPKVALWYYNQAEGVYFEESILEKGEEEGFYQLIQEAKNEAFASIYAKKAQEIYN